MFLPGKYLCGCKVAFEVFHGSDVGGIEVLLRFNSGIT